MEQTVSKRRHIKFRRREDGTECFETSVHKIQTPGRWNRVFRNIGTQNSDAGKMEQTVIRNVSIQNSDAREDGTECFETSAHKIQTPGKMDSVSKRRHIKFRRREDGTECFETLAHKIQKPGRWNRVFRNVGT